MTTQVNARLDLVEAAVDTILTRLRLELPRQLAYVFQDYAERPTARKITLEAPRVSDYFLERTVEAKALPSVYVLADMTTFNLLAANITDQTHPLIVTILLDGLESEELRRKSWRYGRALYHALHDYASADPVLNVFVQRLEFGNVLATTSQDRKLQTEVVARILVRHAEALD